MENFQVEMNEYLPLRDVVFQTLRNAILKGELKPGERLMEIQLAQKLGVSQDTCQRSTQKAGTGRSCHYDSEKRCHCGRHHSAGPE